MDIIVGDSVLLDPKGRYKSEIPDGNNKFGVVTRINPSLSSHPISVTFKNGGSNTYAETDLILELAWKEMIESD